MTTTLNVITLCGSLRKASYNAALARALPALAPAGMDISAAPSIADFPLYSADIQAAGFPAAVEALAAAMRAADGVILCTPEYNWSIAGPMKNAIDWLSRLPEQPFKERPVALQSCSPGMLGGARMQYHLRQSMMFVDAQVLNKPEVFVNFAAQKFDEKTLALTDKGTIDIVKAQLVAFAAFIGELGAR